MNDIGSRIKELRKSLNMSQAEFASNIGLTFTAISKYEYGINAIPDRNIFMICNAYNVSERWLRTGEGDMHDVDPTGDPVQDYLNRCTLDPMDRAIITGFFALPPDRQRQMLDHIRDLIRVVTDYDTLNGMTPDDIKDAIDAQTSGDKDGAQ